MLIALKVLIPAIILAGLIWRVRVRGPKVLIALRVLIPLAIFMVGAVPLETWIQSLPQIIDANGHAYDAFVNSVFLKAAACIYSVTVLLECGVVLARPHMKMEGWVGAAIWPALMVITGIILSTYGAITTHTNGVGLAQNAVIPLLTGYMVLAGGVSVWVHMMDFTTSDAMNSKMAANDTGGSGMPTAATLGGQ